MGYTLGLGSISSSDFTLSSWGTAKAPSGSTARAAFVKLQQVVNRFYKVAGFSPFTADGELGSITTAALKKAASYAISRMGSSYYLTMARDASSAKDYAGSADSIWGLLEGIANSLGLTSGGTVSDSGGGGDGWTPSPSTDPGAPVSTGPGFFDQITSMQIAGLPLLPVLGIAALIYFKKKGKSKRGGKRKR